MPKRVVSKRKASNNKGAKKLHKQWHHKKQRFTGPDTKFKSATCGTNIENFVPQRNPVKKFTLRAPLKVFGKSDKKGLSKKRLAAPISDAKSKVKKKLKKKAGVKTASMEIDTPGGTAATVDAVMEAKKQFKRGHHKKEFALKQKAATAARAAAEVARQEEIKKAKAAKAEAKPNAKAAVKGSPSLKPADASTAAKTSPAAKPADPSKAPSEFPSKPLSRKDRRKESNRKIKLDQADKAKRFVAGRGTKPS